MRIYDKLRILLTACLVVSLPLTAMAECKIGVFGGKVCTDSGATTTSNYHQYSKNSRHQPRPTPHFPDMVVTQGRSMFVFDPKQVAWAAYAPDGRLIKVGPASGGQNFCPDIKQPCLTPTGEYTVYRKGPANCKSTQYPIGKGGAPMPYCMFFKEGYAIHGSSNVPAYNASHGCIRVLPVDAKWLSKHFIEEGTQVIILPY